MNYEDKIKELKIELPEAKAPVGSYVATKITGKLLFLTQKTEWFSSSALTKLTLSSERPRQTSRSSLSQSVPYRKILVILS